MDQADRRDRHRQRHLILSGALISARSLQAIPIGGWGSGLLIYLRRRSVTVPKQCVGEIDLLTS